MPRLGEESQNLSLGMMLPVFPSVVCKFFTYLYLLTSHRYRFSKSFNPLLAFFDRFGRKIHNHVR